MRLNKEELVVGFLIQLPFFWIIKLWCFPVAIISGILWAMGGSSDGHKLFRRLGIPLVTIIALMAFKGLSFSMIPAFFADFMVISTGYGLNSWLWKFWNNITNDHLKSDFLTRMSIYIAHWILIGLVLLT